MSSALPQQTFYRRQLPSTCIALSSPKGRHQFESALRKKGCKSFFVLMEQFTTQPEPAYCGISSLVMVLNALAVDPRRLWKGVWRWYHEELLNCCMDLEEVKQTGITLNVFSCLAKCQGLTVGTNFAQDRSLEDFREAVALACVEKDEEEITPLLVVSYSRMVLEQTGTGHFSPIAAYDPESDQTLILDTARFKYGAHWVPLPLLFEAMQPIDPDTGKSRGYVLLSYAHDDSNSIAPISILLRSTKAQNPVRQLYKHFLLAKKSEVIWDEVLHFWTKDGKNPTYIWEMMEPQLSPTEQEAVEAVKAVRALGQALLPSPLPDDYHHCRAHSNRAICLAPEEAIFIVYLASLSLDRRTEIVCAGTTDEATKLPRQQLLVEADLVRCAINISDEFEEEAERMEHNIKPEDD